LNTSLAALLLLVTGCGLGGLGGLLGGGLCHFVVWFLRVSLQVMSF
jgi:hypothetical protein